MSDAAFELQAQERAELDAHITELLTTRGDLLDRSMADNRDHRRRTATA